MSWSSRLKTGSEGKSINIESSFAGFQSSFLKLLQSGEAVTGVNSYRWVGRIGQNLTATNHVRVLPIPTKPRKPTSQPVSTRFDANYNSFGVVYRDLVIQQVNVKWISVPYFEDGKFISLFDQNPQIYLRKSGASYKPARVMHESSRKTKFSTKMRVQLPQYRRHAKSLNLKEWNSYTENCNLTGIDSTKAIYSCSKSVTILLN